MSKYLYKNKTSFQFTSFKSQSMKRRINNAWDDFYNDKEKQALYDFFTINATAKAGYSRKYHTEEKPVEYSQWFDTVVMKKIKRRFSKNNDYIKFVQYFYEFGDKSKFKSVSSSNQPHHIHGFIIIPKSLTHRIWIEKENRMCDRLIKDFKSGDEIDSVVIKPIYYMKGWSIYQTKMKGINDNAY